MLFFTSDTHFNDSKIIKQHGRAFSDVESMNTTLISNWNTVISPEFVVIGYHDFLTKASYTIIIMLYSKYNLLMLL
jgi:calcineurin-like phosphoesterase family protein